MKVTVVGAGAVGATCAENIARKELLKIQSWAQKTADSCSYDDSTKNKMKIRIRQAFKDATESKIITNEECKKFRDDRIKIHIGDQSNQKYFGRLSIFCFFIYVHFNHSTICQFAK